MNEDEIEEQDTESEKLGEDVGPLAFLGSANRAIGGALTFLLGLWLLRGLIRHVAR